MSFILDALKKSEAERQRRNAPGVARVPDGGGRQKTPRWMWVLVALLAVNLAVLLGVLLRPDRTTGPGAIESATTESPDRPFSELVKEAKRSQTESVATAAGSAGPTPVDRDEPAINAAMSPVVQESPVVTESYATFQELRANGQLSLPDLHLDIHVYSERPADRFVFVNMSKYKENATLAEGPFVRHITPEGVVLEYLGTDFLLPRE